MTRIVESSYLTSAAEKEQLPAPALSEIAFAGRSNVGKSSLMNRLMGRKNLVRVSSMPGCTKTINHFKARLDSGAEIYLVDLPGYGYSRVPKQAQAEWKLVVEHYLSRRETLRLVVLIVDLRRGIEQEEIDLIRFLRHHKKPFLVAATKTDRAAPSARLAALQSIRSASPDIRVIGFSSKTGEGTEDILSEIQARLEPPSLPSPQVTS